MAEKDAPEDGPKDPDGPSLELPAFGFRRKKRRSRDQPPPPADVEHEPAPEPVVEAPVGPAPAPAPTPEPTAPEPATASVPEPTPAPAPTAEPTAAGTPLFVEEASTAQADDTAAVDPGPLAEPARRGRPRPVLPRLGPVPAALATGLLVGLLTVGLVWASQSGCELVRGTSSCGDAGFLLLLAVLVLAGWLGGVLLRAFGVPEGGSTSFLAMGLVAVALLLFLADQLFAWWMVVVVPVVAMGAYVLAHRVSTAMVEPGGREMHR